LLVPFGRRLVWQSGASTFRADGRGQFVDVEGRPVALPPEASVSIAHPLALAPELRAAWTLALGEQPFPQLARVVTVVTPDERDDKAWHGASGAEVPTATMKGKTARLGWRRGDTSGGYINDFWKAFPFADVVAHIAVDEMPVALDMSATCTLRELYFLRPGAGRLPLGEVHPIALSEAVAEVQALAGRGGT
jgi:hypothetical protein